MSIAMVSPSDLFFYWLAGGGGCLLVLVIGVVLFSAWVWVMDHWFIDGP